MKSKVNQNQVDLSDVQGNILKGFNKPNVRLIFFKFGNKYAAMEWLSNIAEKIPSTKKLIESSKKLREEREQDPFYRPQETWLHGSLSKSGIEKLELPIPPSSRVYEGRGKGAKINPVDESLKDPFDPRKYFDPFYVGMKSKAAVLGDTEESAPENWDKPFTLDKDKEGKDVSTVIDALLIAASDQEDDLGIYTSQLIADATLKGIICVGMEIGNALVNEQGKQVEHFGFRDGVSQPLVKGVDKEYRKSYVDYFDPEDFVLFGLTGALAWANNGSFLVFRKLEQHVSQFWKDMREAHDNDRVKMVPEQLAAKLVGRWKSGAPLAANPDYDPVAPEYSDKNDFQYVKNKEMRSLDDATGKNTPIIAHTRWVNPRDSSRGGSSGGSKEERRHLRAANIEENAQHRILRRGIPYGPSWAKDPEKSRGLLFICYQRDLEKQFEYIQNKLVINQHIRQAAGPTTDTIDFQQANDYSKLGLERWITTKGGGYFFSPSISFLERLKDRVAKRAPI
jgi:Dyp-type peroxidase family